MIDRLFTKTFAWCKKHWIAVLLLLLLLFLLDSLFFFVFSLFKGLNRLVGKLFPGGASTFASALSKYYNWAHDNQWLFAATLLVAFPPIGWIAFAWLLLGKLKDTIFGSDTVVSAANPTPPAGPEPSNTDVDLSDVQFSVYE